MISLYERHAKNKTRPLLSEYSTLLQHTLRSFSRVFFIIDGLDECPDSVRSILVAKVRYIQPLVSTFITSRFLPTIEKGLPGAIRIEIEPSDDDIRVYLEQQLKKWESMKIHIAKDPSLPNMIIGSIVTKARRMFLLARLYMDSLMRSITLRKIKAALTLLPEGLDNMYDDAVERIQDQDPEYASLTMKVLSWIYFAIRPLNAQKLQHALAAEPDDSFLDEDGLIDKDLIISVCGGLVSVQGDTVILYLFITQSKNILHGEPHPCSMTLKPRSLELVLHTNYLTSSLKAQTKMTMGLKCEWPKYALLEYAASHWDVHVQRNSEVLKDLTMKFLCRDGNVLTSVQVKTVSASENKMKYPGYSQEYPKSMPRLAFVASLGLCKIACTLLKNGASIEEEDSLNRRPIHRAIRKGHESMTRALLERGADAKAHINDQEPPHHSAAKMQESPLHLTAMKENDNIVQQLLSKKVKVNVSIGTELTPLHMAATNGHSSIMELLISQNADVNAQNGHGATAVYRAAEDGQIVAL